MLCIVYFENSSKSRSIFIIVCLDCVLDNVNNCFSSFQATLEDTINQLQKENNLHLQKEVITLIRI